MKYTLDFLKCHEYKGDLISGVLNKGSLLYTDNTSIAAHHFQKS